MPTSSAPLTKTNGDYEVRIYDQVVLRAMGEAQTSPLSKYRPTKKETMCHAHQARGSGTCEPTRVHRTHSMRRAQALLPATAASE
jgi:hypothetical protein